jgi:hypothetical protein
MEDITTPDDSTQQVTRRIIGDTPQHARHLLWDSDSNTLTQVEGGLSFALGVACMEAELACDENRLFRVMHPNMVVLYDVKYHQGYVMVRKAS